MSISNCFLSFAIVLAFSNATQGQDSLRYSTLSFSVGLNSLWNKDKFQYPYTYKGINPIFHSSYTLFRLNGQHIIDFTYTGGKIESIASPKADNKLLRLNYNYFLNLTKNIGIKNLNTSLGIGLQTLVSKTNYLPEIESSKSYLSGGAYLTLGGNLHYHLNKKNSLRMQFGLPVFGIVYRPDFEVNGKTLTKTTFAGKSNLFSVKLEYNYSLTSKFNFTATYDYNYFTVDKPLPIAILQNGLSIGLRKTF